MENIKHICCNYADCLLAKDVQFEEIEWMFSVMYHQSSVIMVSMKKQVFINDQNTGRELEHTPYVVVSLNSCDGMLINS